VTKRATSPGGGPVARQWAYTLFFESKPGGLAKSIYLIYQSHTNASANVNATNNWWDTTSTTEIQTLIYDWTDNVSKGIVDYSTPLTAPSTSTPPSPPQNVAAQTGPTTIQLTWSANPESDLSGYKVHYDTDAAGYPYALTQLT